MRGCHRFLHRYKIPETALVHLPALVQRGLGEVEPFSVPAMHRLRTIAKSQAQETKYSRPALQYMIVHHCVLKATLFEAFAMIDWFEASYPSGVLLSGCLLYHHRVEPVNHFG